MELKFKFHSTLEFKKKIEMIIRFEAIFPHKINIKRLVLIMEINEPIEIKFHHKNVSG